MGRVITEYQNNPHIADTPSPASVTETGGLTLSQSSNPPTTLSNGFFDTGGMTRVHRAPERGPRTHGDSLEGRTSSHSSSHSAQSPTLRSFSQFRSVRSAAGRSSPDTVTPGHQQSSRRRSHTNSSSPSGAAMLEMREGNGIHSSQSPFAAQSHANQSAHLGSSLQDQKTIGHGNRSRADGEPQQAHYDLDNLGGKALSYDYNFELADIPDDQRSSNSSLRAVVDDTTRGLQTLVLSIPRMKIPELLEIEQLVLNCYLRLRKQIAARIEPSRSGSNTSGSSNQNNASSSGHASSSLRIDEGSP